MCKTVTTSQFLPIHSVGHSGGLHGGSQILQPSPDRHNAGKGLVDVIGLGRDVQIGPREVMFMAYKNGTLLKATRITQSTISVRTFLAARLGLRLNRLWRTLLVRLDHRLGAKDLGADCRNFIPET